MFCLALKRGKSPSGLRQEKELFQARIKNPKSVLEDAKSLAFVMVRNGLENPRDGLMQQKNVPYWEYVEKFHPKYMREVMDKARVIARGLSKDFFKHPEKYPMPSKQPAGGGMGGLGAAATGKVVTAAIDANEPYVYLYKNGTDFLMYGTWASLIASGTIVAGLPYLANDGALYHLHCGSNRVPRNAASIQEFRRMESEMPKAMADAIMAKMKEFGQQYNSFDAYTYLNKVKEEKDWFFAAFNARFAGPSAALALEEANSDYPIAMKMPEQTLAIRKAIGDAMEPFVKRLVDSLGVDGVKCEIKMVDSGRENEPFMAKWKKYDDARELETRLARMKEVAPDVMYSKGTAIATLDMRSLVMTMVSMPRTKIHETDESYYKAMFYLKEAKEASARRVLDFMTQEYFWPYYQARPITEEEVGRAMQTFGPLSEIVTDKGGDNQDFLRDCNRLMILVKASKMDDAGFLQAWMDAKTTRPTDLRSDLSMLAYLQGRKDVLKANPEMALANDDADGIVEPIYMVLDPTEPLELEVIKRKKHDQDDPYYADPKRDEAIVKTGDPELIQGYLNRNMTLAAVYVVEHGGVKGVPEEVNGLIREKTLETLEWMQRDTGDKSDKSLNLAMMAALKANDEEAAMAIDKEHADRADVLHLYGSDVSRNYMKLFRVAFDGTPLPAATEVLSMPDNPLALAKGYQAIGDTYAMLVLFSVTLDAIVRRKNPDAEYAAKFMYEILAKGDQGAHANALLAQHGMKVFEDGNIRALADPGKMSPRNISLIHVQDAMEAGDLLRAARLVGEIFKVNQNGAFDVMAKIKAASDPRLFVSMLPQAMVEQADRMPQWANVGGEAPDIEAQVLPNGRVLVKTGSAYKVVGKNICFASSPEDAVGIAMGKMMQGKSGQISE